MYQIGTICFLNVLGMYCCVYRNAEVAMDQVRFIMETALRVARWGIQVPLTIQSSVEEPSDDTNQKGIILVCIVTKKTYR